MCFFFQEKEANEVPRVFVGSEMCIRGRCEGVVMEDVKVKL